MKVFSKKDIDIYICIWGCLSFYVYADMDVEREGKNKYIYIYTFIATEYGLRADY